MLYSKLREDDTGTSRRASGLYELQEQLPQEERASSAAADTTMKESVFMRSIETQKDAFFKLKVSQSV